MAGKDSAGTHAVIAAADTRRRSPRFDSGPRKGHERREKLLAALDDLLQQRSLAELQIIDIARAAGLNRSSFYFYFPTKEAAVAALLEDVYDAMLTAASPWYEHELGTPHQRLRTSIAAAIALWREHHNLILAMFDATGRDPDVRDLWQHWLDRFTDRAATRITQERDAGRAPHGVDAHELAAALQGMIAHAMERDVRRIAAGATPTDPTDVLTEIWHKAVYTPQPS